MSQPSGPAALADAGRRLKVVNEELETLELRWLELGEQIEAADK
jgi:ATP-binding cassette, subfamily F, member 3